MGKNVLIVLVPVLINKDVFEPSYNDLKFMVRNCNYIRTSLIQKGPQNKEISMTVGKATAAAAAAAAKSLHSCLALRDPIDGSPSGSAVPGILQGRTLEWVAISFSNA